MVCSPSPCSHANAALRRHDAVTRGVDHALAQDRAPSGPRLGDDAARHAVLHDDRAAIGVMQQLDAGFGQQFVPDVLDLFRVHRTRGSAPLPRPFQFAESVARLRAAVRTHARCPGSPRRWC